MAAAKRALRDQLLEREAKNSANLSVADRSVFLRSTVRDIVSNIEQGTWTASQVLDAFIAQAIVAHSATNCVTEVLFDDARKRARELDAEFKDTNRLKGPLHGVEKDGQVVEIGNWSDKVELSRLEMQCFKAAWIANVLHEGIGMPRIVDPGGNNTTDGEKVAQQAEDKGLGRPTFQSVDTVGDIAISWTLGKMVLEASKEVPPIVKSNPPKADDKLLRTNVNDIQGYDTTIGFTACANKPAQITADFVQTMVDAGAVPFVKTNVPQTMYAYECNNPIWGRTSNPYNAAYSSGGSSGGEACMLAFDASVIGLGSDIAGSLRIPASYCGVYSLKPGIGRVSDYGAKESFPGFDGVKSVCGPMARCMDDLELACRVSFGAQGVYNDHPPLPFRNVTLPKKLRFGYYTSDGIMKGSPACIRAVEETMEALRLAGHECIELDQHLTPEIMRIFLELTSADGYKNLLRGVGSDPLDPSLSVLTMGPKVPQFIRSAAAQAIDTFVGDNIMADILRLSGHRSVEAYHDACARRNEIKQRFYQEFWHKHNLDGIITYVHASPQMLHGGSNMLSMMSANTLTYNLVDSPAGVVPVTRVRASDVLTPAWSAAPGHGSSMCEGELYTKPFHTTPNKPLYDPEAMTGMPIGLQIVGKRWEEKVLVMMRVVDEAVALGRGEHGFGPGRWEERVANRAV